MWNGKAGFAQVRRALAGWLWQGQVRPGAAGFAQVRRALAGKAR